MPPTYWPDHLLTVREFTQLPEDNSRHYELVEGVLHVAPKAASLHQRVVSRLSNAVDEQLPGEFEVVPGVEVVLERGWPPTVRAPDGVVIATKLIDENRDQFDAQDVLLAIEVVSPGSAGTDRVTKAHEYARAGIPFYWVIIPEPSIRLTAGRLSDGSTRPRLTTVASSKPMSHLI